MKKVINYFANPNGFCLTDLANEIFDCDYVCMTETIRDIEYPHYLGFFNGKPLEIHVLFNAKEYVVFSCGNWVDDYDLKKALTVFYMKRGIYPSFDKSAVSTAALYVKLEKL